MDSLWSLYEHLGQSTTTRLFSAPLASAVPDGNKPVGDLSHQVPAVSRFIVADLPDQTNATATTNKTFSIQITPGTGFAPEPDFPNLPDPVIRLHAMTTALVRFRPADNALVFQPFIFESLSAKSVPWWQRWIEAGRIPGEIAFINIDVADLTSRLQAATTADVMPGLTIQPLISDSGNEVPLDAGQIQNFVTGFFAGTDPQFTLIARAGAVLGQAGLSGSGPNRELRLQVRYADHTDSNPQPMNPRELLYLMFGKDSTVATTHPLLKALEATVPPPAPRNTKQMILRPPLRTWARAMWEAGLEETFRSGSWAEATSMPAGTVINSVRRERPGDPGHHTDPIGYGATANVNKCNIFVSEIAVRSGFKACIHHIVEPVWHYVDASSYANLARTAQVRAGQPANPAPIPIKGGAAGDDTDKPWGMTYGQKIAAGMTLADLNALVKVDGRCMVVAMMRPRRFEVGGSPPYVTEATCPAALKTVNSGHIVIVREFDAAPVLVAPVDPGFTVPPFVNPRVIKSMTLHTAGAFTNGALANAPWNPTLNGRAGGATSNLAGIRIQLLELLPGGDPDTIQGVFSLNVKQTNTKNLGTRDEAAVTRRLAPHGQCCVDPFPAAGGAQTVTCVPGFQPP